MSYRTAPATHSGAPYDSSPAVPPTPDPLAAMSAALTPKRAVSYIRVSTREQAERAGTEEGFSIPAQREANKKKAASMGALVVKEFVDRGESARSANRPELQKMLAYLRQAGDVDYVIVHKLDRLARNRADDVEINQAFEDVGVRLVSTSENIDQTPGGVLLHGIMSSIAEFYSRNLASEVIKGMGEKARSGGTIGKAPLGYRNVRGRDAQGREIRTVELDPDRAPLMRLAFTEYATGKWTVARLADHLAGLGLDLPATPNRPAKPITKGRLHTLLRHPYYRGVVTFQGVEYPGQHQALADPVTWHEVQDILDSHRNGERQRIHNHHLKTTVVCGQCGSRLLVQNAKNGRGVVYPYFVCSRRHRKHDCAFRAVLIEQVETRMSDLYHRIHLTHEDREAVERHLLVELDRIETDKARDVRSLTTRRTNIEDQRRQLLHAHYNGAIPLDLLKTEQDRLARELATIQHRLDSYHADATLVRQHLTQALDLLEDCHRLYTAAPKHLKKLLNTVFFDHVLVNPDTDEHGNLVPPRSNQPPQDTKDKRNSSEEERSARDPSAEPSGLDETDEMEQTEETEDMSAPAPAPIRTYDQDSQTSTVAFLHPPFDQLASPGLRRAARLSQPGPRPGDGPAKDGGGDGDGNGERQSDLAISQRKTPTLKGGRTTPSEIAPRPTPQGAGSCKSVVVREKGLEPSRPKAPEPKSGASTNSATHAAPPAYPVRRSAAASPGAPAGPAGAPRVASLPDPGGRECPLYLPPPAIPARR